MKNGINPASATSPTVVSQIRGDAYSDAALSDGNHLWTGGLEPWMKASNGTFVPYVLSQNSTHYFVDNQQAPFVINKNNCITSIYDNSVPLSQNPSSIISKEWWDVSYHSATSPLFVNIDLSSTACTISVTTNSSGIFIDTLKAFPAGTLEVTYEKIIGKPWETILTPTNTLPASSYSIKPIERISGISADSIVVGATPFTGNAILSSQINQSSSIITIHKGAKSFIIDESKALTNFKQLNITKTSSGFSLSTDFGSNIPVLSTNQKFAIDPTFGYSTGSLDDVWTNSATGTACPTGSFAHDASGTFGLNKQPSGVSGNCGISWARYDISSIPSNAISVTSTTIKLNLSNGGNSLACDYVQYVANDPSSRTDAQRWTDVTTGTAYVSNDSVCTTFGSGLTIVLGSTANTDVKNQLASAHWFAFGWRFTSMVRDGSYHVAGTSGNSPTDVQLQVVYTVSIHSAPTGFTTPTKSTTAITPRWSSVTGATWYLLDRESPTGHGFSQITNTTQLNFADTGLTAGTQYNYEVFAGNSSGGAGPASAPSSNYTTLIFPANDNFTGYNTFGKGIILNGNITAPHGICIGNC